MTLREAEEAFHAPWVECEGTRLVLGGVLTAADAASWRVDVLSQAPESVDTLDLGELDLDDGEAVVEAVNLVTALRDRHGSLLIREAPQMLAHTLYKVGALNKGVSLEAPRSDEGTTAN